MSLLFGGFGVGVVCCWCWFVICGLLVVCGLFWVWMFGCLVGGFDLFGLVLDLVVFGFRFGCVWGLCLSWF